MRDMIGWGFTVHNETIGPGTLVGVRQPDPIGCILMDEFDLNPHPKCGHIFKCRFYKRIRWVIASGESRKYKDWKIKVL
jgi:hypothetical protein